MTYKFIFGDLGSRESLDSAVFISNIEVLEIESYVKIVASVVASGIFFREGNKKPKLYKI